MKELEISEIEYEQAEAELAATRSLLEAAIAQSPSGILIADAPDVTIRLGNAAAYSILGGDQDLRTGSKETPHANSWQAFHPDGSSYELDQLPLSRAVLQDEVTRGKEVIIRDAAGIDHWVSVNAAPIHDEEGRTTAGIVVFHDITDRKEGDERLRMSERRLQDILDTSLDGILLHEKGNLIDINVKASLHLGYSREELLEISLLDLVDKEDMEAAAKLLELVSEAPDIEYGGIEMRLVRRDGTKIDVEYFSRATAYEGRQVRVIAFRDISERKRTEDALRESEPRKGTTFQVLIPVHEEWTPDLASKCSHLKNDNGRFFFNREAISR